MNSNENSETLQKESSWADELNNTSTTDIMEVEETPVPVLTPEEKLEEIKSASEEHKDLLTALVEINKTADVLKKIDTEESMADRNKVLNIVFENFAQKRYMTNLKIEELKLDLIKSVMDNLDNLDLETRIDTIEKLHNMTTLDAQKALSNVSRGNNDMPMGNMPGGVNITLNNASGNGSIDSTTNSGPQINLNQGTTPDQLKDVASLNSTLKSWKETGAPRKVNTEENTVDASFTEKK